MRTYEIIDLSLFAILIIGVWYIYVQEGKKQQEIVELLKEIKNK